MSHFVSEKQPSNTSCQGRVVPLEMVNDSKPPSDRAAFTRLKVGDVGSCSQGRPEKPDRHGCWLTWQQETQGKTLENVGQMLEISPIVFVLKIRSGMIWQKVWWSCSLKNGDGVVEKKKVDLVGLRDLIEKSGGKALTNIQSKQDSLSILMDLAHQQASGVRLFNLL